MMDLVGDLLIMFIGALVGALFFERSRRHGGRDKDIAGRR